MKQVSMSSVDLNDTEARFAGTTCGAAKAETIFLIPSIESACGIG